MKQASQVFLYPSPSGWSYHPAYPKKTPRHVEAKRDTPLADPQGTSPIVEVTFFLLQKQENRHCPKAMTEEDAT
ncbi:hypothetical protein N7E81_07810 [Reichenbachiella carrageenanivorans]|uniref:Uncharacterized protein n=1 Tax=Reichenbachiella carrageenanivorans TaxID=2979869 RepID=A0ABY6D788_9BACT|nr:hypothetical protein [Reichenbachiella carrageenanivorans]UXX81003.1 hypothetical protein N7E81_07810 [Reichenbachiella carrageenanivorans]